MGHSDEVVVGILPSDCTLDDMFHSFRRTSSIIRTNNVAPIGEIRMDLNKFELLVVKGYTFTAQIS